jgi:hypothetical protein
MSKINPPAARRADIAPDVGHFALFPRPCQYRFYVKPEFCTRKFGADVRREGRRCISILQALRNETDAPKSRDRLFRRTSAFLHDAFITRWVKRKSGARNNLHAVFIDKI